METRVKYAGFIKRQEAQVQKVIGKMRKPIPDGIDYAAITTLRMEAREKLAKNAADHRRASVAHRRRDVGGRVFAAGAPGGGRHGHQGGRARRGQAERKELAGQEREAREALDAEAAETPSRYKVAQGSRVLVTSTVRTVITKNKEHPDPPFARRTAAVALNRRRRSRFRSSR